MKEWPNNKQVEKKKDNFTQEVEGGPDLDELRKKSKVLKILTFVGLSKGGRLHMGTSWPELPPADAFSDRSPMIH